MTIECIHTWKLPCAFVERTHIRRRCRCRFACVMMSCTLSLLFLAILKHGARSTGIAYCLGSFTSTHTLLHSINKMMCLCRSTGLICCSFHAQNENYICSLVFFFAVAFDHLKIMFLASTLSNIKIWLPLSMNVPIIAHDLAVHHVLGSFEFWTFENIIVLLLVYCYFVNSFVFGDGFTLLWWWLTW